MRTIINRRPTNTDPFDFGNERIPLENREIEDFDPCSRSEDADDHQEGYIGFYDEEGE